MSAIGTTIAPERHRITVDQFEKMIEAGVFGPEDRIELLHGELLKMSPIGPSHASVVDDLNRHFSPLWDHVRISVQGPMRLSFDSRPQPDLMLLKNREDRYRTAIPNVADILLAVEVSDSTFVMDYNIKRAAYAEQGIREYWVVDVNRRRIHVFRRPENGVYQSETIAERDDTVAPELFRHHVLTVRDLLG